MAYDEGLAERVQDCFAGRSDVEDKKMFGGLCFMAYVLPEGIENDAGLASWVAICEAFVESLPPKRPKTGKKT